MTAAWLAVLLATVAAQATPTPADEAGATALVEKAAREYDEGRLDEALKTLEQARGLSPRPGLLYNIAQVHRAKGDCPAAYEAYTRFIAQIDPADPNRERAVRRQAEMRACIEKAGGKVPEIAPPAPPPPVTPEVTPPAPVTLPPPAAPPVVAMTPGAPAGPATIDLSAPANTEERPLSGTMRRKGGWVLAGVGAAAAFTAALFQWRALDIQKEIESDINGRPWSSELESQVQARHDAGARDARLARWIGAAALLSAGGGAFLLLYNPPQKREGPAIPSPQSRTVLVGWQGRF